jgi:hypothetical protein
MILLESSHSVVFILLFLTSPSLIPCSVFHIIALHKITFQWGVRPILVAYPMSVCAKLDFPDSIGRTDNHDAGALSSTRGGFIIPRRFQLRVRIDVDNIDIGFVWLIGNCHLSVSTSMTQPRQVNKASFKPPFAMLYCFPNAGSFLETKTGHQGGSGGHFDSRFFLGLQNMPFSHGGM